MRYHRARLEAGELQSVGLTEFPSEELQFEKRMTKIEALEREVEKLSREELATFRQWFLEYDWQAWDRELEEDIAAGKLDKLAAEALEDHRLG